MKRFAVLALVLWTSTFAFGQDSLGMQRVADLVYWQGNGDVQMVGNLAYILDGMALNIVNLSDPVHPALVGRFTWFHFQSTGGLFVQGNRAYIGHYYGGFVLDVSNPAHPVVIGEWEGNSTGITAIHDTLAISGYDNGVPTVLDIADPTNVHEIGTFPDFRGPGDALGWVGDYLCLMGWPLLSGVLVYDMSDPTSPQRVAACDTLGYWSRYGTLRGNYALLASDAGLRIIDLTNPLQPTLAAVCDVAGYDVTTIGTRAVVSNSTGLSVWNLTNPYAPVFEGSLPAPQGSGGFMELSGAGNLVCAENWRGAKVMTAVNISNPTLPVVTSQFGDRGALRRFAVASGRAYLADSYESLRTLDISLPSQPHELASLNGIAGDAVSAAQFDGYTYLAAGYPGMLVVNTQNPAVPETVETVKPVSLFNALRVLTYGSYLYLFDAGAGSGPSRLYVFSLADPAHPALLDSIETMPLSEWNTFGVAVAAGYLYLADESFMVYSLADPAFPVPVGGCGLPSWSAYDLAVVGNYAYLACGGGGLLVVDITDPTHPIRGNYYGRSCLAAAGDSVLAIDVRSDVQSGIQILSLADPVHPQIIGYYPTDEMLEDMHIAGRYLFTASYCEFRVYHLDALDDARSFRPEMPGKFALYPAYPNPFNPTTTIAYDLPSNCPVRLDVLDVLGRRVQQFNYGMQLAGVHEVRFDGSSLSSGTYFVRLQAGPNQAQQKMVLVK